MRRLVADRAWGRAGAVGGVQRSEASILGLRLEDSAAEFDASKIAADVPTRRKARAQGQSSVGQSTILLISCDGELHAMHRTGDDSV